MKNIIRVVDCTDSDLIHGYLITDVDETEIQEKIYEIKHSDEFLEEFPDWSWTIDDIISYFPSEWDYEYIQDDGIVVEI